MSIPGKVLIALLSALLVAVIASFLEPEQFKLLPVFITAAVSAVLAVVLSHRALPVPGAIADGRSAGAAPSRSATAAAPQKPQNKQTTGSGKCGSGKPDRNKRDDRASGSKNGKGRSSRSGSRTGSGADKGPTADTRQSAAPAKAPTSTPAKSTAPLESGTVKWFNVSKGYGFIIRENGDEIFVHHRSVHGEGRGRLDDGSSVRFRVVTTDKGPQAEDVEPV